MDVPCYQELTLGNAVTELADNDIQMDGMGPVANLVAVDGAHMVPFIVYVDIVAQFLPVVKRAT
jgi:hypothetical protein